MKKSKVSPQTEQDALAIAKATQKPNQTKEQTKLIAKGIEKGIAEYKKRHKEKARDLDKKRKKLDSSAVNTNTVETSEEDPKHKIKSNVPMITTLTILLIISMVINIWQYLLTT